ncbi:citrate synthase [Aspergillus uvarum CBS 121591]|uniref:Citrate synthase n=1 Tax=Aspergillus uvarum CBS 121591 TaxID=1448315 RepID=A0A319DFX2_9EURO|nr:citrate synthase [Aspergillus uvarum CBS 121591]PYH78592.1 citrate synthase [Aspergillus uvarum CBS 121591]
MTTQLHQVVEGSLPLEPAHLQVLDSRSGASIEVPIHPGNYIHASDLSKIQSPEPTKNSSDVDLHAPRSLRILDNGFANIACMKSSVTLVDGTRGIIRYREVPIQQLFHDYVYEDVMHLLIWGSLPSAKQKIDFRAAVAKQAVPPQSVVDVIAAFPPEAETFTMLMAGLSAFAASDDLVRASHRQIKPMFHGNLPVADEMIVRTIAYYATTVALIYCHKQGKKFTPPQPHRSLIGNLLWMMGITDPRVEKCLDKLWILYADHEMTNSTAALLHAGSSLADPISGIIAGIGSGMGPLHGGAIDLAYEMLEMIGSAENVPEFIEGVKTSKTRLFGYGHRVYKTRDPRLSLIEELMNEHKDAIDANPILRIAMAVDRQANEDQYFVERNVKANADLKGCFLYTAMGFETNMFAAIVGLSRVPGGLAHWRETQVAPIRLWRPQQVYVPFTEAEPKAKL